MDLYTILPFILLTNVILFALPTTINSLEPSFTTTITTNTTITGQHPPPPPQQPQQLHNNSSHTTLLAPVRNVETRTSLSFPLNPSRRAQEMQPQIMRVMLKEVMQKLSDDGYSVSSSQMNSKFASLVALDNITVFVVSDGEIKAGSAAYISRILLHFVPNQCLMMADLKKLRVGTKLGTLERGQFLEVTSGGTGTAAFRINQVEVKNPDLVYNDKIAVHGLSSPFPRIRP